MINTTPGNSAYNRFINLDGIEDRIIYYLLSPNKQNREQLEQTQIIWKLLSYDDIDALYKPLPQYKDVMKLVSCDNISQDNFRVFRSCHLEDAWTIQSTFLKIYIDSILPENRYISMVNIGIDMIVHNKIINVNTINQENPQVGNYCKQMNITEDEYGNLFMDGKRISKLLEDDKGNNKVIITNNKSVCLKDIDYTLLQSSAPIDNVDGVNYYINQKSRVSMMTRAVLSLLNGANIQGVGQLEFSMELNRYNQGQYEIWNNRNFEGMKIVLGTRMSGVS